MSTDDWQGRLGRRTLLVNARSADEAVEIALQDACDIFFQTDLLLGPDDDVPDGASLPPPDPLALASSGGAWIVLVARLGHATALGSEYSSAYFAESIEFLGARPHDSPCSSREPAFWMAVSLALDERAALCVAAAAPAPARRRPSL